MKLLKQFNYVEELNFEVVKSVKMDGVGKVYDMCIPSKSQFVANGIVKFFEFLEAKEDKVPDCIMSSSIEEVEAWLRGFSSVES